MEKKSKEKGKQQKKQEKQNQKDQRKDKQKDNNKDKSNKDKSQQSKQKSGKKGRDKRSRGKNYEKYPEMTLETEIPPLPTKEEELEKPSNKERNKLIDDLEDQIDDIKDEREDFYDMLYKQNKDDRKTYDSSSFKILMKEKAKQRRRIMQKFNDANNLKKQYNKQMDQIQAKIEKLKKHFVKNFENENKIIKEMDRLNDALQNQILSLSEEKNMQKALDRLHQSIKYVEPVQKLYNELRKLRDERKEFAIKSGELFGKSQVLKDEMDKVSANIDKKKKEEEEIEKQKKPELAIKKAEFKTKINELKDKIDEVYAEWDKKWDTYYDQQRQIKKIKWMAKQLDYLKKEEREKKIRERERKEEEEQLAEMRKGYYNVQIAECEDLINYCRLLLPQEEEDVLENGDNQEQEEVQQEGSQEQFKNDNVREIVNKRNKEHDANWLVEKKKGRKAKRKKREAQKVQLEENPVFDVTFMHSMEIIEKFQDLKVAAPNARDQVDPVIKQLQDKVDYYKNLEPPSDKVLKKKLYGRDRRDRRDKRYEDDYEDSPSPPIKKQKAKRRHKKKAINLNQKDMFPELSD